MTKLLDFLKPNRWRQRPEPDPEVNDAVLARLTDNDLVYRALMDHAYGQAEEHLMEACRTDLSRDQRAFACGALAGIARYLQTVESTRDRARQLEQKG